MTLQDQVVLYYTHETKNDLYSYWVFKQLLGYLMG